MAELKESNLGYNDGLRGESSDPDAGKEYWAGAVRTSDSLTAGRIEVRHFKQYGYCRNPKWAMMEIG